MSFKKQYINVLFGVGIAIVLYPIFIATYEVITSEKDSVTFLADYSPAIGLRILDGYIMVLGSVLCYSLYWVYKRIRSLLMLKKEQKHMELLHLQSQVNPHFFFNMLNNLYGLVDKDSEKAQALILKLSDMMRYSIYDGQKSSVPLKEEVVYLKNFIELHKMRYHKEIAIQFHTDIQDETCEVMPLLFIILLENAFKHGVENLYKDAFVHVNLIANEKEIQCTVENNFDIELVASEKGIGLKNLKRRLQLVYPKKHTLAVTSEENVYKSELTIQLS